MNINHFILTYTEDTNNERRLIEELIRNINRRLSSQHTWINLTTTPLSDAHHMRDLEGNGIHLVLTSRNEYPQTIEKISDTEPSLPKTTHSYVLIKEDVCGSHLETASHTKALGKGQAACPFSNDGTLRTYVALLLEPVIRIITGEEAFRYSDGTIYALGIRIACLEDLPFMTNIHGLFEQKSEPEEREMTTPVECHRRYSIEKTAGYEVRQRLHAALRVMELSMLDPSPLMSQVGTAFMKGDIPEAERLLGNEHTEPAAEMNAETRIRHVNRMVLRAALRMARTPIPIDERAGKAMAILGETLDAVRETHDPSFVRLMADYSALLRQHNAESKHLTMAVNAATLLWHATGHTAEEAAAVYGNIAEACNAKGDYLCALEHYKKAHESFRQALGERHPAIASINHAMARTIIPLGYYPKALELLRKACDIREESQGEWNPITAATYDDIGSTYHRMGEDSKALTYYKRATAIREKTLGCKHPITAASYTNTGFVYYNQRELTKAKSLFLKALAIYERDPGASFPEMADSYGHVADTCYNMGDYAQASELYSKRLLSQMLESGGEDPKTASLYSSVGNCHLLQEDYRKAAECYGKALAIRKRLHGADDKDTASSYYDLGTAYACMKDYPRALEYFSKSLETRQRVLGDKHADTCASCWKVGLIYFQMRAFKASLPYLERTAEHRRVHLGAEDPKTADIYADLGYAYINLMEHEQALEYFRKAVEIQERVLGDDHPKYKRACFFYAKLLEIGNKGDEAVIWGRKAVKAFPKSADALSSLASACMKTGRYDEAMAHYEHCLKLRRERGDSIDSIHETEAQIKQLKTMMRASISLSPLS